MTNLKEFIEEINRFEAIISEWDESQRCVAVGLKSAIEALHKEALTRLIKSLKQESMSALRLAVTDEVVYAVLLYHELVKPPILERIQTALEEVRPGLKSHNGDIELIAFKPPDTVEVKLIGTCSSCPASTLTLSQGVEQAIKNHCPEITKVIAVNDTSVVNNANSGLISPFSSSKVTSIWVKVTNIEEIPDLGVLPKKVAGHSLILYRQGVNITCYRNACTHLASPLDTGKIENSIITCPAHGFQYNLQTGECLTAADVPLQPYLVQIKGDKVFVQIKK